METENTNIHVIKVDMENRPPEDIARDAALQIAALFDHLVAEQENKDKIESNYFERHSWKKVVWQGIIKEKE